MIELRYKIPTALQEDMQRAPGVIERHVDRGAGRGAQEVAREMKRAAPKALNTLNLSVLPSRLGWAHYQVAPRVNYADMVERGTGPGGHPPVRSLLDWIAVKRIAPSDPNMSERDLAWAMARSIAMHGTPARPFAAPTAEQMESRVLALVRAGIADGLREARLA